MRTVCTLAVCLLVCGCSGKKDPPTLTFREIADNWSKWEGQPVRIKGRVTGAHHDEGKKIIYFFVSASRHESFSATFPESEAANILHLKTEVVVEGTVADKSTAEGLSGNPVTVVIHLTRCKIISE